MQLYLVYANVPVVLEIVLYFIIVDGMNNVFKKYMELVVKNVISPFQITHGLLFTR